jgi:hypothetical protein
MAESAYLVTAILRSNTHVSTLSFDTTKMATWVKSYDPSMANVPYFALQVPCASYRSSQHYTPRVNKRHTTYHYTPHVQLCYTNNVTPVHSPVLHKRHITTPPVSHKRGDLASGLTPNVTQTSHYYTPRVTQDTTQLHRFHYTPRVTQTSHHFTLRDIQTAHHYNAPASRRNAELHTQGIKLWYIGDIWYEIWYVWFPASKSSHVNSLPQ